MWVCDFDRTAPYGTATPIFDRPRATVRPRNFRRPYGANFDRVRDFVGRENAPDVSARGVSTGRPFTVRRTDARRIPAR